MSETDRKKRVRAAHRGSATRILGQISDNLESTDGPNLTRLRQQNQSLSEKLVTLSELDKELIDLVEEEDLDQEVEKADTIREKMTLAIIEVDRVLNEATAKVGQAPPSDSSPGARGASVGGSVTIRSTASGTPPPNGDGAMHTPSTVSATRTSTTGDGTTHASSTGSTTSTSTSTTGDGTTPTPPTGLAAPTRTSATVDGLSSSTPLVSTLPPVNAPYVKLPKLSLKKFSGDLTKWVTFWDSFEASIHRNPHLSAIDKFNYLNSYLESSAAEAIAGLTLTSANYEEAIATLKKRFGNTQLIVNRHMDALLGLTSITSHHDLKGLRRLYDAVEAHVRGLRALGVSSESYGGLLTSILMNKLPPEIRLIISREITGEWDMEQIMKIVNREVDARERSSALCNTHTLPKKPHQRGTPTTAAFMASNSGHTRCVYCDQEHQPSSCTVVTEVSARKEALRKAGRCFVCLKRYHILKECRSTTNCSKCRGRHHSTICPRLMMKTSNNPAPPTPTPANQSQPQPPRSTPQGSTSTMYTGTHVPVLLQTARLQLYNLDEPTSHVEVRAILDSGSQRTYVTSQVQERLNLPAKRSESLCIKTFGNSEGRSTACEVVDLGLCTKNGEALTASALVIPFICNPLTAQPINDSGEHCDHLLGLDLADSAEMEDRLEVDMLVGCDLYWNLVTGRVLRGRNGPTAIHTKFGWVLSGPADQKVTSVNLSLSTTHALRIDSYPMDQSLDDHLKRFWELESLGIMKDESSVYEKFVQQISFNGQRYQVSLPWKESHPPLPSNLGLCRKRLAGLLRKLRQTPQLLAEYDSVIKDQISKGIVKVVDDPHPSDDGRTHYLPHHGVVREDKATSKLRIVYNASARAEGPSLNDCLYTGPKFGQSIFNILLRFRLHKVALAGDIEKAFLMVSVDEGDRDSLRFLWTRDLGRDPPDITTLRFARVVFGVSSSPFLLNATINHHMETYRNADPSFVDKFLSSIYVDDVSLGSNDVASTYKLYLKSKSRLAEAGFNLRKFVTNSDELRHRISTNECLSDEQHTPKKVSEEDQSYAKESLGSKSDQAQGRHKILGIQWDYTQDRLCFDVGEISHHMKKSEPTKRNVVGMATRFFDPLGIVAPVTIQFKMFFQQLCEAGVNWDDQLTGELLIKWNQLCTSLQEAEALVVPRCYLDGLADSPRSAQLVGFCDASSKAYAAIVYLKLETDSQVQVHFLAAKTRVSPLQGMTIPRLELLSALLLSKLMSSVHTALESDMSLGDPVCYSDSRVALYWIQGCDQEWKQFVENRVTSIRTLIPPQFWKHCPGKENPADIPSRGMDASELVRRPLWLAGPHWLHLSQDLPDGAEAVECTIPEDCRQEMKQGKVVSTLIVNQTGGPFLGRLVDCERFSSLRRLLRVTALVLKFIRMLRHRTHGVEDSVPKPAHLTASDIDEARVRWIRESQNQLPQDPRFSLWKRQFDLFTDDSLLWRCGGRMARSELPSSAKTPILLDKSHALTRLIVLDAHKRVMHNGVKETLTQLRSDYWVIRGRQYTRKIIHCCVVCRRMEGRPYRGIPPPPLPEYRVQQSRPFCHTGVDFAGATLYQAVCTSGRAEGVVMPVHMLCHEGCPP